MLLLNRGSARTDKGDVTGAVQGYSEAARLDPRRIASNSFNTHF